MYLTPDTAMNVLESSKDSLHKAVHIPIVKQVPAEILLIYELPLCPLIACGILRQQPSNCTTSLGAVSREKALTRPS